MLLILPLLLLALLLRASVTMEAVQASCLLFVRSVMPGLFPYLVLALMLVSRLPEGTPDAVVVLMGWCGGSPTGARLLTQATGMDRARQKRIAVTCATMSPMFLTGTISAWTGSARSGVCVLVAVLAGGLIAGLLSGRGGQRGRLRAPVPLSLGQAVDAAAHTMLLVCGTMALLRVAAALAGEALMPWPRAALAVTTLLEVTCGTEAIAALPLPLALRTALIAGATGFGGTAILLQNRAVLPEGLFSLWEQVLWQLLHGLCSFLLALGLMLV